MGLQHGGYCVGCCWFLMGLLFFGGVMNLYWIVGLALFVSFEKTVPAGQMARLRHWRRFVRLGSRYACARVLRVLLYAEGDLGLCIALA